MIKIVDTNSIWATSINYLNDVSERDHFRALIRDRIPTYLESHVLASQEIAMLSHFLDSKQGDLEMGPFVASCSGQADSLPQWRSYCPNGNGVAIGFKVDCLNRAFLRTDPLGLLPKRVVPRADIQFGRITYLGSSDSEILDFHIKNAMKQSIEEVASLVLHPAKGKACADETAAYSWAYFEVFIDRAGSFIKHPSFSNEDEYRLLVDGVLSTQDYLEYRVSRTTLIPYIPVLIPKKHSSAPLVPAGKPNESPEPSFWDSLADQFKPRLDFIDRVVIGPTTDKTLSLAAVSSFFERRGMRVEVVSSTIPYRDR